MDTFLRLKVALRSIDIKSEPPKRKLPITLDILKAVFVRCDESYDDKLLKAAMSLAHYGLLRAAEFTIQSSFNPEINLCIGDITFNYDETCYLNVCIKKSKTDVKNCGFDLKIGCSGLSVCAMCNMTDFIKLRMSLGKTTMTSPLFMYRNGTYLTRSVFVNSFKSKLKLAGYETSGFSGHSFRIGGATSAAAAGLADWEIKVLGRWTSDAYQRYIRTSSKVLASFAKRMSNKTNGKDFDYRNPYTKNFFR